MKELPSPPKEMKERLNSNGFSVIIIGDASSGKTTLLNYLRDSGFSVRPEPDNAVFPLFVKDPKQHAYFNQLYKTSQLMNQELQAAVPGASTDPRFNESGVLATDIYNRYLRDQNLMTADQFEQLNNMYRLHLDTMPKPNMVVYLYASDEEIRARQIRRDGTVVHDPKLLQPYWDRLLDELGSRGISVYKVNTGDHPVEDTAEMILRQVDRLKQKVNTPRSSSLQPLTTANFTMR